ncbi:uncharacterized protein V6R79_004810 [Siganus canaliculatus]
MRVQLGPDGRLVTVGGAQRVCNHWQEVRFISAPRTEGERLQLPPPDADTLQLCNLWDSVQSWSSTSSNMLDGSGASQIREFAVFM